MTPDGKSAVQVCDVVIVDVVHQNEGLRSHLLEWVRNPPDIFSDQIYTFIRCI